MTPEEKLDAARAIRGRVHAGELMIGLMDFDEVDQMFRLFDEASQAGLLDASLAYAEALLDGVGEPPDPEKAIEAYGRAIEQGAGRDTVLARLRTAYFHAPDVLAPGEIQRDIEALLEDDPAGDAALLYGYFHYRGFGRPVDHAAALAWHERAAAKGNADAMFELYVLYSTGQGSEQNDDLAMEWVMRAAEAGSVRAMYNLGAFYATGNGVDQDLDLCLEWYEKAAQHGHGRAAATLSLMFYEGDDLEQDLERAEEYFELAYENGYDAGALFDARGHGDPFV
jgi:TPR repeat protein